MLENDDWKYVTKIPELFLKFYFFSKLKTSLRSSIYLFLTTASIKIHTQTLHKVKFKSKFIACGEWYTGWMNEYLKNSWCALHKII